MSSHDNYHADPDAGYETDLRTALITGRSKLLKRRKRQFRWGAGIGVAAVAVTVFGWTQGDRGTTLVADGQQVTTTAPLPRSLVPTITVESVPAPDDWGRFGHGVVFADAEALIWGGWAEEGGTPAAPQLLAYSPAGDSWREMTPAPFPTTGYAEVAWTGTELLVVGGQITDGEVADSVGAYDPATDTWRVLDPLPVPKGDNAARQMDAVWDGEHLTVWWPDAGVLAQLSPATGAWTALSPPTLELGVDGTADLLLLGGTLVAAAGSDHRRQAWPCSTHRVSGFRSRHLTRSPGSARPSPAISAYSSRARADSTSCRPSGTQLPAVGRNPRQYHWRRARVIPNPFPHPTAGCCGGGRAIRASPSSTRPWVGPTHRPALTARSSDQ